LLLRARFVEHRPDGVLDEPRPGAPRTITDDTIEEVPRLRHAFGLEPHRTETFLG
jgi:hypothetical protein